jgi:iron complex transport system substrate-binding protein
MFCLWIMQGVELGAVKFLGVSTDVTLEIMSAIDPDVIIGTGANWASKYPGTQAGLFGCDATENTV